MHVKSQQCSNNKMMKGRPKETILLSVSSFSFNTSVVTSKLDIFYTCKLLIQSCLAAQFPMVHFSVLSSAILNGRHSRMPFIKWYCAPSHVFIQCHFYADLHADILLILLTKKQTNPKSVTRDSWLISNLLIEPHQHQQSC